MNEPRGAAVSWLWPPLSSPQPGPVLVPSSCHLPLKIFISIIKRFCGLTVLNMDIHEETIVGWFWTVQLKTREMKFQVFPHSSLFIRQIMDFPHWLFAVTRPVDNGNGTNLSEIIWNDLGPATSYCSLLTAALIVTGNTSQSSPKLLFPVDLAPLKIQITSTSPRKMKAGLECCRGCCC